MSALIGPRDGQLEQLQCKFPTAVAVQLSDGSAIVRLPHFTLPAGWNRPDVEIRFLSPFGYPLAKPDCFYAAPELRLADGSMPRNSRMEPLPQSDVCWLWFSYHAVTWHPLRDSYLSFVRLIEQRLVETN